MAKQERLIVRALRTQQGDGVDVFAFFLRGSDVVRIADISRISRDDKDNLRGFQRKEIKTHVKSIADFLRSGPILFPNAIILALSPEIDFKQSRGPIPEGMSETANSGTLSIPMRREGDRAAWIVDGQQRSMALASAEDVQLPVPVVGFVSDNIDMHREQFILVNKAKPLPTRLINELLPEVSVLLPRDLAARQIPSALCSTLNSDQNSPFHKLIRRLSDENADSAVVTDTALVKAIQRNLKAPFGALSQFKSNGGSAADTTGMYDCLLMYWTAVRETFPEAWGKAPGESRLMHSAGIQAMGALMDPIMMRAETTADIRADVRQALKRLASHCCWIDGRWDELGWRWNEVESTPQHIRKLSDHLIKLDRELSRRVL